MDIAQLKTSTYTERMKGYIACFAREAGIWDDEKGFDLERAVQQYKFDLPENRVRQIFVECIHQNQKAKVKPFDCITPIQKCVEITEIGSSFKAALIKAQKQAVVRIEIK